MIFFCIVFHLILFSAAIFLDMLRYNRNEVNVSPSYYARQQKDYLDHHFGIFMLAVFIPIAVFIFNIIDLAAFTYIQKQNKGE